MGDGVLFDKQMYSQTSWLSAGRICDVQPVSGGSATRLKFHLKRWTDLHGKKPVSVVTDKFNTAPDSHDLDVGLFV